MKVKVDFYKTTGKWYSGCVIEMESKPWDDKPKIMDEIVEKQTALIKGDLSHWTIVLDNVPEDEDKPNEFWKRIIQFGQD